MTRLSRRWQVRRRAMPAEPTGGVVDGRDGPNRRDLRRQSVRRHLFAIAYDVTSDRRRARVARILGDCGTRVQKSVFECHLSETEACTLEERLRQAIHPATDRVRIYRLCGACRGRVRGMPQPRTTATAVQFV